jgi:hypothetical protein
MEPKEIISKIIDHIQIGGVVAGGSVRDLVLKRIPKDYDIFIFEEIVFGEIVKKKGIFDEVPQKAKPVKPVNTCRYPSTFSVYNTTLDGKPVQIIWSPYYSERRNRDWFSMHKIKTTGEDVVMGFDFTINMIYVDSEKKVHITDEAKTAIQNKRIIFNQNHKSSYATALNTCEHLVKRMVYLADKLDFKVAPNTLSKIYNKYTPMEKDMEMMEWMKAEVVSAY